MCFAGSKAPCAVSLLRAADCTGGAGGARGSALRGSGPLALAQGLLMPLPSPQGALTVLFARKAVPTGPLQPQAWLPRPRTA